MKYMLMMNAPRGTGDYAVVNWAPDDFKAHIAFMKQFGQELSQAGELVGAEGLASPAQAKIVRASPAGAPEVTDGPFAEAKEFLAGYWIVDVEAAAARLRDCRARVRRAGPRRKADEHADRGARSDVRATASLVQRSRH